jgi:hypothetical protein
MECAIIGNISLLPRSDLTKPIPAAAVTSAKLEYMYRLNRVNT